MRAGGPLSPLPYQPFGRIGCPIDSSLDTETLMTARMFRLTQIHQRIDERLRIELRKRRPDWQEFARLEVLRQRAKHALNRLAGRGLTA